MWRQRIRVADPSPGGGLIFKPEGKEDIITTNDTC